VQRERERERERERKSERERAVDTYRGRSVHHRGKVMQRERERGLEKEVHAYTHTCASPMGVSSYARM